VHVIARFPIPSHWPVDVAIDIGVAKPHDILYRATDPRGFRYLCFEENIKGDGTKIADSIIKKKQRYNLRINRILIDPLAKADQNNENSTYDKIRIGLNRFDMYLETASKDKDDGIISINNMLLTVNGLPAYFIFRDLPITTAQLSNWMYDKLGKPSKIKDDMCENAYRLELLNTAYEDPEDEDDIFDSPTATRNATTGY